MNPHSAASALRFVQVPYSHHRLRQARYDCSNSKARASRHSNESLHRARDVQHPLHNGSGVGSSSRPEVSPFVKVSPQILLQIINLVLCRYKNRAYFDALYRIVGVCRAWRFLINSTPRLWNLILGERSKAKNELALLRSATAPLTVRMPAGSTKHGRDVLRLLPSAASTLHVLDVSLSKGLDKKEINFAWPAPLLQDVRILYPDGIMGPPVDLRAQNLFRGHSPWLKKVKLVGIVVNWKSNMFNNLTHLEIVSFNGPHVSDDEVLAIVKRCPRLELLDLARIPIKKPTVGGPRWSPPLPTYSGEVIVRPTLKQVRLDLSEASTGYILQAIRAPNCTRLSIKGRNEMALDRDPAPLGIGLDVLDEWAAPMRNILGESPTVDMQISDYDFVFRTPDKVMALELAPLDRRCQEVLSWLSESVLPPHPDHRVQLVVCCDSVTLSAFDQFNITSLKVKDQGGPNAFLQYLSRPSAAGWPFPSLKKLYFPARPDPKVLLHALKSRYQMDVHDKKVMKQAKAKGTSALASVQTATAPVPLEVIHLPHKGKAAFGGEVENIVGPGVLKYVTEDPFDDGDWLNEDNSVEDDDYSF